jgi:hypothetical protein
MLRRILSGILITMLLSGCVEKLYQAKQARASSPYEQIDFQALVKRYMNRDKTNSIEGIYSVSGWVTKKGKGFLGSTEKEKTTDRRENYAQVAILKDPGDTGRDFIELSLDKERLAMYPVVGEFNSTAGGSLLLYKHLDPKNKNSTYTFTLDKSADVLEGVRVEAEGGTTVTYKLTYVKIYPK